MGDFVKPGGYVVTTPHKNYLGNKDIDQDTLKKIVELLGIGPAHRAELARESIRTVFIHARDKS
jgi:hypothetical protein